MSGAATTRANDGGRREAIAADAGYSGSTGKEHSMMTIEEFRRSLPEEAPPASMDLALQALWWSGRNDWERAHGCVQQREGEAECDWVHAYLHRVEGDLSNAGYWYRRAGKPVTTVPHQEEWTAITTRLLAGRG